MYVCNVYFIVFMQRNAIRMCLCLTT